MSLRKSALCLTIAAGALSVLPGVVVAQDQPVAEVPNSRFRAIGEVTTTGVNVRSGPAESYYIAAKVNKGDKVVIVGYKFDWLKILPPGGSYSLVAKQYVERQGTSNQGTINADNVLVRAGSLVSTPAIATPQAKLDRGVPVTILGEAGDQLKIAPPEGAYLYVKKNFVQLVRAATTNESLPTPAAAVKHTGPATRESATATEPVEAVPANMDTPITAEAGANDAAPQGTDTTIVEAPPLGAHPATPAAKAPAAAAGDRELATQFHALELRFEQTKDQPIDQRPVDEMLKGYQSMQDNTALTPAERSRARFRTRYLQVLADQQKAVKEAQEAQGNFASRQAELDTQRKQIEDRIKSLGLASYAAVGRLEMSSIQKDGKALMRLVDPADGRTLVYVMPDRKAGEMLTRFVGIKGEVAKDERLSVDILEPTEIDPVDPARVMKGVSARIYPPSIVRDQK